MSKISVTTIAGLTSGGDANTVKIESGDTFQALSNATVGGTLGVTGVSTFTGNVGVGMTPNTNYGKEVNVLSGTSNVRLKLANSTTGSTNTDGFDLIADGNGAYVWNRENSLLAFATNNDEKLRLHSNGVFACSAGVALGVGVNNTASNVLDDYEEGTWTPTLVSSGATFAYSVQQGIYTKIGDLVTFNCVVQLDGGGNSFTGNSVTLNGWPFTSRNSQGAHARFFIYGRYLNLDAGNGYTYAYADLNGNSASAPLKEGGDNTPTNNLASNDLSSSSGQLYLHGHYYTDS